MLKKKNMTQKEFDEFCYEILPQQLFHVMSSDIDDETGAKVEEVILVQMLSEYPGALKYKPLKDWVDEICGKCYYKKEN